MTTKDNGEEGFPRRRELIIFGRNVAEIKCFRKSFIYGISGGVFGGLLCFLLTSKARFSSHVAFGSIWICVFAYWIPCRYKYESQVLRMNYYKEKFNTSKVEKSEQSETN